ncbi:unnamed protein product [Coregonus sp. 'balchen']|nr:unnamed protein product [Coregonus sp. 'balchen']
MSVFESPKARINSAMLSQYISRPICFVGRVEKVHPTGKSFSLSDGEGKSASVELNEPLDEELSGVVEVLDLELYNEALKVIHDFPQHYPFEIATSG